ncbi:MAG: alpha/beta fold hydrolase [Verrucomicrobiota bacterium]
MELNYRYFGGEGKEPLVIIHGLLGSSRNWIAIGKALAADYEVFALDMRNHGESPHDNAMDYDVLTGDLMDFLDQRGLDKVHLLGHSMGGKVAMQASIEYFRRVESLCVVDIAPKNYAPYQKDDFEAMRALDLQTLGSRKEADALLQPAVPDYAYRMFLLTNLKRAEEGGFAWGVNLEVLYQALDTLRGNNVAAEERYTGPSLFILGGQSRFVSEADHEMIREHFPRVVIKTLQQSGHNPHLDATEDFIELYRDFARVDWGCEI